LDRENVPSSQVRSRLFRLGILNNSQFREWVSVK
jgi:Fe2+ transport system protein FeoA